MSRQPATPPHLLRAIAAEDWPSALRCAARFQHLGEQDRAIRQAWAAHQRPDFYREIGHDPAVLLTAGIAGLRARFTPADAVATSDRHTIATRQTEPQ